MSLRSMPADRLQLSASPRVFLLPDEVAQGKKARATRTALIRLLVFAVVIVAAGVGFALFQSNVATTELAAEQSRTAALLAEQKKYAEVTSVQNAINVIQAAQVSVTANEVVWLPVISSVQRSVPDDIGITGITGVIPDTTASAEPDPLASDYAAGIVFTAVGPQQSISSWLAALTRVDGVVAVAPGSVQLAADTGLYTATVAVMFGDDVLSTRFAPKD